MAELTKIQSSRISDNPSFKNKIINGNFDHWQRDTTQVDGLSSYGSDDRFNNSQNGGTRTHDQMTFTVGQSDVPGNPIYYSQTDITAATSASGEYIAKIHKVEYVGTFSGTTATLSFWAKADSAKDIAIEFIQDFGTGGTPSSQITGYDGTWNGTGVQTLSLTTSWAKYSVTVEIPSISGKTLGTEPDSWIGFYFWFSSGSAFDTRNNTLGHQTGAFDISKAQFESGPVATDFEERPLAIELSLCRRYFEKQQNTYISGKSSSSSDARFNGIPYLTAKRSFPAATVTDTTGLASYFSGSAVGAWELGVAKDNIRPSLSAATGMSPGPEHLIISWESDAEL